MRGFVAILAAALVATSAAAQPASGLYVFIYHQGPSWKVGTPMGQQPAIGRHGAYMKKLFDEGHTFAAGPMTDTVGGLLILRAASAEEAAALLAADPAVSTGLFTAEVHAWSPAFRSDQPLPKAP